MAGAEKYSLLRGNIAKIRIHPIKNKLVKLISCIAYIIFIFPQEKGLSIFITLLVAQSCPTLCDSKDCSLPTSSVHGILQARILEWVALPSFRGSSRPWDQARVSCISCRSRFFTGRFFTPEPPRKPVVLVLKNPPANAGDIEDLGSFPRSGRSMEEGMAAHCSILAWRIP